MQIQWLWKGEREKGWLRDMPISLKKGQKVSITKDNPGLSKVVVGLGWDVNQFDTGGDFDLDAAAFMLTDTGRVSKPYKNGSEWKFNAIGSGYQGGLAALCANYGVDVE